VNKTVVTLGNCFIPRPTVAFGHKGEPTVGTPQQQLESLFFKTQVAVMYDYKYRVEWTLLKRSWFVLPTSIKTTSRKTFDKNYKLTPK